ncbi:MAG TPA: GAF domain-containing SpoIIE family protein phosphatase [Solirubrobacteraceae bacterium]|jgi:serine phosphatase RsbU (regulator of sigma subunit)
MAAPPAERQELRSFLWNSDTIFAAEVSPGGEILDANPALRARTGGAPAGTRLTELLTAPQRPALREALERAGDAWSSLTLSFFFGDGQTPEDRLVRLLRRGDAVLVVAEPARVERDHLLEQVLALNDELVGAHRTLGRRQRELELSRAEAQAATRRASQLEAVTLTGLTRPGTDEALGALLDIACSILACDGATLRLLDDAAPGLRVRAAVGAAAPGPELAEQVAASGRARLAAGEAAVPLIIDGAVTGVLGVHAFAAGALDAGDLDTLELVGQRAALAVGHAELRERERRISETLQRSLLPERLPAVPGLTLVARYLPRVESVHVGGDLYDAALLPGGGLSLAIGDVAGKGLRAAALMGQLRSALRAYAFDGHAPDAVLNRLDRLVVVADDFATALHVVLDPATGRGTFASAGHPLPLRLPVDGPPTPISVPVAPPLGAGLAAAGLHQLRLAPGETLVLFTDGLFERRGEDPEDRLAALRDAFAATDGDLAARCDAIIAGLAGPGYDDDVALLAVRRDGA